MAISLFYEGGILLLVNSKILPLSKPLITSYPYHANMLSVLCNYKDTIPWIYNNYIQLETPNNSKDSYGKYDGVRLDFYSPLAWKTCPWIYYQRISRDLIANISNSIVDFFIKCIDTGYYIYTILNNYYIHASDDYQINQQNHDCFIFGYDYDKKVFHICDFFKNGKYTKDTIDFAMMEKSYNTIDINRDLIAGVELISYRDRRLEYQSYSFDIEKVYELLNDYILSKMSYKQYRISTEQHKKDWIWGIAIYKILLEYIDSLIEATPEYIDFRPFHILMEHKTLMSSRILFMGENGYLRNYKNFLQEYKKIENDVIFIRNIYLKFFLTKNIENLYKMKNVLVKIPQKEAQIIKDIIINI